MTDIYTTSNFSYILYIWINLGHCLCLQMALALFIDACSFVTDTTETVSLNTPGHPRTPQDVKICIINMLFW